MESHSSNDFVPIDKLHRAQIGRRLLLKLQSSTFGSGYFVATMKVKYIDSINTHFDGAFRFELLAISYNPVLLPECLGNALHFF